MILNFALVAVAVALCSLFADREIALFVSRALYSNSGWAKHTAALPDLLLPSVAAITVSSFLCYLVRAKKGIYDAGTLFFQLLTYAIPASFLCKSVLKMVFGRLNPRHWLVTPHLYGFHWFHGGSRFDGFPSGHMVVFTTLMACCWRIYPRYRIPCILLLLALALAMLATNYHFLSDIVAGAYLGLMVEAVSFKLIAGQDRLRQAHIPSSRDL